MLIKKKKAQTIHMNNCSLDKVVLDCFVVYFH